MIDMQTIPDSTPIHPRILHFGAQTLWITPRIADCPLQLQPFGVQRRDIELCRDGPGYDAILDTEVVAVHAQTDVVVAGSEHVAPRRSNPLFHRFRHYVGKSAHLGRTCKAEV